MLVFAGSSISPSLQLALDQPLRMILVTREDGFGRRFGRQSRHREQLLLMLASPSYLANRYVSFGCGNEDDQITLVEHGRFRYSVVRKSILLDFHTLVPCPYTHHFLISIMEIVTFGILSHLHILKSLPRCHPQITSLSQSHNIFLNPLRTLKLPTSSPTRKILTNSQLLKSQHSAKFETSF